MTPEMEQRSIRVRIYGTEYPLRVDDEQLTFRAAQHIDRMMSELHNQLPDQPPTTLAVLSALNVSESLFHEQRYTMQVLKQIELNATVISKSLVHALHQ